MPRPMAMQALAASNPAMGRAVISDVSTPVETTPAMGRLWQSAAIGSKPQPNVRRSKEADCSTALGDRFQLFFADVTRNNGDWNRKRAC